MQESQQQLEQIKQIKQSETFPAPQSTNGASNIDKDAFFQLIPSSSNDLQNNLLYDQKSYQIASPIPVFVVAGVPQPSLVLASSENSLPMLVQEDNCKTSIDNVIANTPQSIIMMSEDTNDGNEEDEEYNENEVTSDDVTNIMHDDDISDVLEILLKNEKWPESPAALENNNGSNDQQQSIIQSNVLPSSFQDPSVNEPISPILANDVAIGEKFFISLN